MNDETKAELMKRTREWLQSCVNAATRSGVPEEADLEAFILAHIDGESARLAAAREELREACAVKVDWWGPTLRPVAEHVRATPLDATPLAAERDALRARVAELEEYKEKGDDVQIAAQRLKFWAENPHACPDHFGARTACGQCFDSERALRLASEADLREAHERLDEFGMKRDGTTATVVEGIAAMRAALCEYQRWAYEAEVARMDLREAVEELHDLCEQVRAGRGLDTLRARAVLAKHPVK